MRRLHGLQGTTPSSKTCICLHGNMSMLPKNMAPQKMTLWSVSASLHTLGIMWVWVCVRTCVSAHVCVVHACVQFVYGLQVVTALDAGAYGEWEGAKFAPEEKFLEKIKAISGISQRSEEVV